jgi:hypothetical protein
MHNTLSAVCYVFSLFAQSLACILVPQPLRVSLFRIGVSVPFGALLLQPLTAAQMTQEASVVMMRRSASRAATARPTSGTEASAL